MWVKLRLVLAAAAASATAACSAAVDSGQARLCRAIIPALNAGSDIEVVRTGPLDAAGGVRVDYRVLTREGRNRRFLECRFAAARQVANQAQALTGLTTDAGPLGEVRLYMLKRFWLGAEGASADPEPVSNASAAPWLPRGLAVSLQHLIFALPPIAIYSLLAAAYALIYGLIGRINLAFGELAAVGGYAAFLGFAIAASLSQTGALLAALVLALLTASAHGAFVGRALFQPLAQASGQQVLIATIALAITLQEYLRLAQGSRLIWVPPVFNTSYAVARSGEFVVTLTPVAVAAAALCLLVGAGLVGLLKISRFGRAWRACADDPGTAALLGIDHQRVLLKTFALASLLAGLAGYVVTVYYGAFGYAGGIVLGLKSLLAAIAGGIGSVGGAFLGGILLGSLEAVWSALFPIEFRDLAVFIVFVVLLVLRPAGLLGERDPGALKPMAHRHARAPDRW